jgi:hypothetical protein
MDNHLEIGEARLLLRDLEKLFTPGQGDTSTLDEVKRLCESGIQAIEDPYCQSLLRAIEQHAEHFFAPDDAAHPAERTALGRVYLLILALLAAFEVRLTELEARRPLAHVGERAGHRIAHRFGTY